MTDKFCLLVVPAIGRVRRILHGQWLLGRGSLWYIRTRAGTMYHESKVWYRSNAMQ
eukprot:SAG11_NODE_224_length_12103_cov_8.087054_2_plen_56_part_00